MNTFKYFSKNRLSNAFSWLERRYFSQTEIGTITTQENNRINVAMGQPTPSTHPHLLRPGELLPGVEPSEFQNRRLRLMTAIQQYTTKNVLPGIHKSSHLVIIPSATKKYMTGKIPYVFRQNSDFMYLSGCLEPDSVLMVYIDKESKVTSTLFMRPKDAHAELWDGSRTGIDRAPDFFGVDEAYAIGDFQTQLNSRVKSNDRPFIWYEEQGSDMVTVSEDVKRAITLSHNRHIESPTHFVQSLRVFKSPAEQELMRITCRIASEAINETMKESQVGHTEHHIFAMVDYKCRMRNANFLAYPPVVASGKNATTIHYIDNTQQIKPGDMVLMDAGCEYHGYSSDITRTWPISGMFSKPQATLYDIIYTLQKELLDVVAKEDKGDTLDRLFNFMCLKLGKYLQEDGLVDKSIVDEQKYAKAGYKFCPHHVSHYLGMDVHDTPDIPKNIRLLPGMVCTIEPGIYIGYDRLDVPVEFRGLGIRIEDDILIGKDNRVELLTLPCIKDKSAIENLKKSN